MVRLKHNSGDNGEYGEPNGVNGFVENGEGNHDSHDLLHDTGQEDTENPGVSSIDSHQTNGLQLPRAEVPESNGIAALGSTIFQGEWPMHRALWMSGPSSIGEKDPLDGFAGDDTESIMSFSSSTATMSSRRPHSHQLGTKVEMVYSLLSMLGSCNKEDMSRTLLEMSNNQDSCIAMRQSGCLPLLIQLLHGSERELLLSERSSENVRLAVREARRRASQALHNIVHAHPDDRRGRREARVLRLLEQIRDYSDYLRDLDSGNADVSHNENLDMHPGPAIAALMKLSFDEEHRHAMCQLGGLQAIAELIQADHEIHGNTSDQFCVTVRRYAGMALTNLTFGDGTNKALLCSMKPFMQALVSQLHSPNEDLRQVTASVLRNLSWRADAPSKQILREVGVVGILTKAAMEACKESTLKSILSALWNLSAHCSMNKADICSIDGALEFLVSTLTYKSASKTLSIIENGGGILRNISSHIAVREDYRAVLRKQKCLQTLLCHLKSPSLTIVSNACGTLWNLSARCSQDQEALWEMGAVGMLRNLVHSKHKMISMGSSAALKNLLAARPQGLNIGLGQFLENGHQINGGTSNMPSLLVRKQRALEADIDENLAETCDNIDSPKTSPTPHGDITKKFMFEQNGLSCLEQRPQYLSYLPGRMYHSINGQVGSPIRVPRSESKDSLGSTRSEPPHYKAQRERFRIFINNNRAMTLDSRTVQERPADWKEKTNLQLEENSNVVLQLFRHLQNGVKSGTTNETPPLSTDGKPPVRPTSLPPSKRGVWNIRANKLIERNLIQNGLNFSAQETSVSHNTHAETNGCTSGHANNGDCSTLDSVDTDRDAYVNNDNQLLGIPGNIRPIEKERSHKDDSSKFTKEHSSLNVFKPLKQDNYGLNIAQCNGSSGRASPSHPPVQSEYTKGTVVLRKKKLNDELSSSMTLTKENVSDETSVDQTPLVISRCSSLSSLTSCFQHSARSSWVSDVSQRTSAVISPTDLPDSPGYCTSEGKPHLFEFTDKVPDADTHGLVRPRPAWPSSISSLPSTDSLPSSVKRLSYESDVFVNTADITHLSSITDQSEISETVESSMSLKTPPARPQNTPDSPEKDSCSSSTESSSSQDNLEGAENNDGFIKDHELVAACVQLGMPNNSGDNYHNNSKLRTKLNNLSSSLSYSRSGIPIKSNNVRLTQSVPNVSRPIVLSSCAAAPINQELPNIFARSSPKLGIAQTQNHSICTDTVAGAICDDNDNLLFNSGNTEARLETSSAENRIRGHDTRYNFSTFHTKSNSSISSKKLIGSHIFADGKKGASPVMDSKSVNLFETSVEPTHRSDYSLMEQPRETSHFTRNQGRDSIDSSSPMQSSTYSGSNSSSCERRDEYTSHKMTTSSTSKIKTAIPQIVRPWNPNFDNEQHPRQLQITSQHLPVYVGPTPSSSTNTQEHLQSHDFLNNHAAENTSSADENASEDILSTSSPSPCDESEGNDSDAAHQQGMAYGKSINQQRGNRPKSRRNKMNRRSTEIRPPSEHSSEDDNKRFVNQGADTGSSTNASHIVSVQSSDCEEKGKEDERTKEKSNESLSRGAIPDLLEGATFHEGVMNGISSDRRHQNCTVKTNIMSKNMTDSMELRRGAMMIAAELEEGIDDCTHSSTSFDLENMKPPSCMGEMSMTSSGLSDLLSNGNGCYINGKHAVDRRRNIKRSKKINSHRFVLKSVRQAIANNLDIPRPVDSSEKPISAAGSFENLSMKSSGTSDLIENINPPSLLDDISMTNSCASLNSISSDILESRSQSLADPRSNSEMYQRLNAAAAMVQVYSRELSNIMTGSMKSSCNSDCLDLVKPPSIFQDIAEVTIEDGTEVVSDPLVSDSELEEELPHDDEGSVPSSDTVHSPLLLLTRREGAEGSTENLNSSLDGDSLSLIDRKLHSMKRISNLALSPQSMSTIDMGSKIVQYSSTSISVDQESSGIENNAALDEDFDSGLPESLVDEKMETPSPPPVRRGPRIVKPINRETVRLLQEKKNADKSVKSIRGRVSANKPKNLLQQITNARYGVLNKPATTKTPASVSGVRPTRTSALRASQNKQTNVRTNNGRVSPRAFLSKPPIITRPSSKVVKPTTAVSTYSGTVSSDAKASSSVGETRRPHPPIKQGTFTKEDSIQKVPATSPPCLTNTDFVPCQQITQSRVDYQNNNEKVCNEVLLSPVSGEPKISSRKLSFSTLPVVESSTSNRNFQRKLSVQFERKTGEKPAMAVSPSSQNTTQQDRTGKKIAAKKSPSSSSLTGRGASTAGSQTASTNSLSSLSSNGLSGKKTNSPKEVPSKISCIWKRSESSSSANSPVTDSSNADKNILVGCKNKIISSKSSTLRSHSVTPPASSKNSIPRSSTYEKIVKPSVNTVSVKPAFKTVATSSENSQRNKQTSITLNKNSVKPKSSSAPTPKVTGGARIVKPVTPRSKSMAVNSKGLKQTPNSCKFPEVRSRSYMSSPARTCFSNGRSFKNSPSLETRVSTHLVSATFAHTASRNSESDDLNGTKANTSSNNVHESDSQFHNTISSTEITEKIKENDSDDSDEELST